jgi:hypothetical protein
MRVTLLFCAVVAHASIYDTLTIVKVLLVAAGIVRQRAKAIQDTTRGRVSLELALLMLTEQPSLMSEAPARLARRILDMSTALNIKQADAAQLLASNPLLLQALPYE